MCAKLVEAPLLLPVVRAPGDTIGILSGKNCRLKKLGDAMGLSKLDVFEAERRDKPSNEEGDGVMDVD